VVGAHELGLGEDVGLESVFEAGFGGVRLEAGHDFGVESVEGEEVAVRLAGRRTGACVADAVEVVRALAGAAVEGGIGRDADGKAGGLGGKIPEEPVGEAAGRSVRVFDDDGEGLGSGGSSSPDEFGRLVGAVAGVGAGNLGCVLEGGGTQGESGLGLRGESCREVATAEAQGYEGEEEDCTY